MGYFISADGKVLPIKSMLNERYDWCSTSGEMRTPEDHPYGFDAYYLWRNFDKSEMKGIDGVYSDRLREWDPGKFNLACNAAGKGWVDRYTERQAKAFIKSYYDGQYACVGFARECNVSTGYPLGIFFIKARKRKKSAQA